MIEIKTQTTEGGKPRTLAQALVEAEREPLFSIDDVEYTIPVEGAVPPALGLESLEVARVNGQPHAEAWLAEMLLGSAGWRALRTCPDIEMGQMQAIMRIMRDRAMGALEIEEGKGA
jgi:hypothetical protein